MKSQNIRVVMCSSMLEELPFFKRDSKDFSMKCYEESVKEVLEIEAGPIHVLCVKSRDSIDSTTMAQLKQMGVELICLRTAGFNNVDVSAAESFGISVARVCNYSPAAIAEHSVMLMLALSRKLITTSRRINNYNFSLEGLMGQNIQDKTIGLIGLGHIGLHVARILQGFGSRLLGYDIEPKPIGMNGVKIDQVSFDTLLEKSDIISLHCPLTEQNHHLIGERELAKMKDGVMIVNTSRGAHLDTLACIKGLKSGKIGCLGIDVYEYESDLFFRDHSNQKGFDPLFNELLGFDNVIVTGHQAFFTHTALSNISRATFRNIDDYYSRTQNLNFLTQLNYENV